MANPIEVQCPVCKTIGVYEPPQMAGVADQEDWRPIPCFFTKGCPGHIWPEFAN